MSEPQYREVRTFEPEKFGLMIGHAWAHDPKRLVFTLSRYKFVAKMLAGRKNVLEIGCGDAFGQRIVQQELDGDLTAIDFDPVFVADAKERMSDDWPFHCYQHDILDSPVKAIRRFDAIFALDVLEHIRIEDEAYFMRNSLVSLADHGVMIVGMPSLDSQRLASPISKAGHVNCKTGPELKKAMQVYFHSVFSFSMSDEVVHTGHQSMAHYLLVVCSDPRSLR